MDECHFDFGVRGTRDDCEQEHGTRICTVPTLQLVAVVRYWYKLSTHRFAFRHLVMGDEHPAHGVLYKTTDTVLYKTTHTHRFWFPPLENAPRRFGKWPTPLLGNRRRDGNITQNERGGEPTWESHPPPSWGHTKIVRRSTIVQSTGGPGTWYAGTIPPSGSSSTPRGSSRPSAGTPARTASPTRPTATTRDITRSCSSSTTLPRRRTS